MRITKQMKKDLTQTLVRQVFQEKFDEICRAVVGRMDFIATAYFKKNHERALALGKVNEDLLREIDGRFRVKGGNICVKHFSLLDWGHFSTDFHSNILSSYLTFYVSKHNNCHYDLKGTETDLRIFEDAQAQLDTLGCKYDEFVANLNSVLASVTTKKALLELLPEAEKALLEVLPDEPCKMPLPIEKAELIRGLL